MKKILLIIFILCGFSAYLGAQSIEQQVVNDFYKTSHTSASNGGKWTKIATCVVTAGYQDFGTVLEIFGNGAGNSNFYFGRLIIRAKRQNEAPGMPTHRALILTNSNIGAENFKMVLNGNVADIYARISISWTSFYFRRVIRGNSVFTPLSDQPFHDELPPSDRMIDCVDYGFSVNGGKVGIGTSSPDELLTVKGKIHAEEVRIDLNVPAPDYVFDQFYDLKPLQEVETFIKDHHHLPGFPKGSVMEESGIEVGEISMKLLQKIEEMTLYLIEMEKENQAMKKEIQIIKDENRELREGHKAIKESIDKINKGE